MDRANDGLTDSEIIGILKLKSIAVVGMSRNPGKAAHDVPRYLLEHGYDVVPINPNADRIMGLKAFASLTDIPRPVDLINIFRPSLDIPQLIESAISKNPTAIWLQLGIHHKQSEDKARENGIKVVYDRCIKIEHGRLMV
ncbi:MAG: CoA-binding protein [Thaumarchaeota archaeon]|nr:CoA-binding protein [Nitrososphaerota archaeon]MCZ6725161.1 CoA-binding protein [Nitrososphaerota archaeon]